MRGLTTKRLIAAASGLVLVLGIAACGDDDDGDDGGGGGGETQLDLVIGDIVPLTGDLADFGPFGPKAADIAVDQINAAIEGGRCRPHRQDRPRGRPDRSAGRRAGGAQGRGHRQRDLHRGEGLVDVQHDPDRRSVTIREGVLQISPASTADEI